MNISASVLVLSTVSSPTSILIRWMHYYISIFRIQDEFVLNWTTFTININMLLEARLYFSKHARNQIKV
jgi:hypothetical protein